MRFTSPRIFVGLKYFIVHLKNGFVNTTIICPTSRPSTLKSCYVVSFVNVRGLRASENDEHQLCYEKSACQIFSWSMLTGRRVVTGVWSVVISCADDWLTAANFSHEQGVPKNAAVFLYNSATILASIIWTSCTTLIYSASFWQWLAKSLITCNKCPINSIKFYLSIVILSFVFVTI